MAVARNVKRVLDFIPKSDRNLPDSDQTKFHLKPIPQHLQVELEDGAFSVLTGANPMKGGTTKLKILRTCLTGWTNYRNETGEPVEFPKRIDDAIDMIHANNQIDMFTFLVEETGLQKEEKKSSE